MALSRMYAQLWGLLFERELGPLPEWVHSPCCAEFVVSKQRVRQRPLAFYASLLNWLGHTSQVWPLRLCGYLAGQSVAVDEGLGLQLVHLGAQCQQLPTACSFEARMKLAL